MARMILPKPRKGEVVCWLFAADRDVAFRLGYNLWADQLMFGWAYGELNNPIDRLYMGLPAIFPEYDHGKIWHQMTRHLPHIRWFGGYAGILR